MTEQSLASEQPRPGGDAAAPMPRAPFGGVGGPAPSSWREQALTRIAEVEEQAAWMRSRAASLPACDDDLYEAIARHVAAARSAAAGSDRRPLRRFARWLTGSPLERAASNLDAAETHLLRLAPPDYVRGNMPSLLAQVRRHFAEDDPRRRHFEAIVERAADDPGELERERDAVVAVARGASSAARREVVQVRSFRNVLLVAATLLTLAGAGLASVGALSPNAIVLCFNPTGDNQQGKIVCPTDENTVPSQPATSGAGGGAPTSPTEQQAADIDDTITKTTSRWDLPLIEIVGLIAAAVATAAALRRVRGTTTPYSLPVALALLKLPTGALTAVLGLLLMRGGFVPGLSALDTSGQIVAWAVIFGYSQEIFTQFVDRQANSVLNRVGRAVPQRRASDSR